MKKIALLVFLVGCGSEVDSIDVTECVECKQDAKEMTCKQITPQAVSCKQPDGSVVVYNNVNINNNINNNVNVNVDDTKNNDCDNPSQN